MKAENEITTASRIKRLLVLHPWLVALAALALYGLTLNHWVTFGSLPYVSQLAGWDWHPGPLAWKPNPQHPLVLVLTLPLRWLPAGWRAVGWNVFTAACAALTLAVLTRSVQLLGNGRSDDERLRERQEHAALSIGVMFLPAAFAALLLAAQLTFWENAVAGTGEMIDLLVFAFLILCLLEYRVSQSESRLKLFAFVYGLGLSNNWALIAFFPCFLLVLLWVLGSQRVATFNHLQQDLAKEGSPIWSWLKHMAPFNWRFALRMARWGALGLLLYGLIPLLGAARGDGSFWELLHQKFGDQHFFLTRLPWFFAAIAGLMAWVALIFAIIDWPTCEVDLSPGAGFLRFLLRALTLVCLTVGVLMFFDVPLSPNLRNLRLGVAMGRPDFLCFYYLAALSVGYFSGFALRVVGMARTRHWLLSWSAKFCQMRVLGMVGTPRSDWTGRYSQIGNKVVAGLLCVAAVGLPAKLFHDNFRQIQDFNSPAVAEFGMEMAKALPAGPAIVLSDDPLRLYLAKGASQKLGLPGPYVFIETQALSHGEYLRSLADQYPVLRNELVDPDLLPRKITDQQVGLLLAQLARRLPVYYLHPSFVNYFEWVCMTPRRLGGDLHPRPANPLATLGPTPQEIATNQAYWHTLETESLAALPRLARRSTEALRIANYYSQILNYWGTELQKSGTRFKRPLLLEAANTQFAEALLLKPNNLVAKANQQYNAHLRNVAPAGPLLTTSFVAVQLYNRWDLALEAYGPPDVPDLDIQMGRYFAQHGACLQAAHSFQRSLELAPNDALGELELGNAYVDLGLNEAALAVIGDMHSRFIGNRLEVLGAEALDCVNKNDYAQADALLAEARRKNPNEDRFQGVMAEIYRLMGDRVLREGKGDAAKEKSAKKDAAIWFKKALAALDEHSQWLQARKANPQDINLVHLRSAELQTRITSDVPPLIVKSE